jgi:subtilisin-like proprotein convertase family protein
MKDVLKCRIAKVSKLILSFIAMIVWTTANGQCPTDVNDPIFTGCVNKTINLTPGQCGVSINSSLSVGDDCPGGAKSLTNNTVNTVSSGDGCNMGNAQYYNIYTPTQAIRYTPMSISNVTFGVSSSIANPFVEVKVWITDGTLNPAGWRQIGQGSGIVPTISNGTYSIPIITSTIMPTEVFAVEVIVPTNVVFGNIAGMSSGNTNPSYFRKSACGVNNLTSTFSIASGAALVMNVTANVTPTFVTSNNASSLPLLSEYKAGVYNLSYKAVDANNNDAICNFTLTVLNPTNIQRSLTCNNQINIALDDICSKKVSAGEILEGGPYLCFDNYKVVIYDNNNRPVGDIVDSRFLDQTLRVTVLDSIGNSCWGLLKIENKTPAILTCDSVYTTCLEDPLPGSVLPARLTYEATNADGAVIPSNAKYARNFRVDVFGNGGATVNDVDVRIDINHTQVSNLQIVLTAPNGVATKLVANAGATCTKDNMIVTIDDEATNNFASMSSACNDTLPGVVGSFKPQTPLSVYDGLKLDGTWLITVIDSNNVDGGVINELALVLGQSGGKVTFPTKKNVTFTRENNGDYFVTGLDNCGPLQMNFIDSIATQPCTSDFSEIIYRKWSAKDVSGLDSKACTQTVFIYRNGISTLQFPKNYDDIELASLSCTQYGSTVPSPAITGRPTGELCDNVQILPHEDLKINICDNSYKLLRKWKVVEWCSGEIYEHLQIIKVLDKVGPQLTCPRDTALNTKPLDCNSDYTPVRPTVAAGECSDNLKYEFSYFTTGTTRVVPENAIFTTQNIIINSNGTRTIQGLPVGFTAIKWRVDDECGNFTECTYFVRVEDKTPPVAVCDQFTKVSIGSNKLAYVSAFTFDDGSYDNCELRDLKVAKMTDKCAANPAYSLTSQTVFRDSVVFCCEEVNTNIMVQLRVTDRSGNSNTCMVEIRVEDKLPPYITKCPADITLDCQADFKNVKVTGEPEYLDNCDVVSVNSVDDGKIDQCGEGIISRTWTVKDGQGFAASCVQRIRLEDQDPFDINDIRFRPDYKASTCAADLSPEKLPAGFGFPQITDDDCSLTSVTYSDQVFNFVDGACQKILRTWTVIDWCTHVPGTTQGLYTDLQVIILENTTAPTYRTCKATDTVDVFDACRGNVSQTVSATDDCTPSNKLKYAYQIDAFNDAILNGSLDFRGSDSTFTRNLPIGVHKVIWNTEDQCGNKRPCTTILTVRDGKKPTPYCLSSVTTAVMQGSGSVSIWAKDFDLGSFDNCSPKNKLSISFSSNRLDTGRVFTCSDMADGKSVDLSLDVHITDEAGNRDYCTVRLRLQDNEANACKDNVGSRVSIGGRIKTESNKSLAAAKVELFNNGTKVKEYMTNSAGNFMLDNVDIQNTYEVGVTKNDDLPNGLSTLDLVLIQRHILGLAKLDSPYKVIAADANNDAKVTASDLVVLRRVILGISNEFINDQKSWRFLDASNPFISASNPFPFNERVPLSGLVQSIFDKDFYAVKIGDVNASVLLNAQDRNVEPRNIDDLTLGYTANKIGNKNVIEVYAEHDAIIRGLQARFDLGNATIIPKLLNINSEDYATNNRATTVSWTTKDKLIKKGELLFVIESSESEALSLNKTFHNEAYSIDDEVTPIKLIPISKNNLEEVFEVYQNEPNPFSQQTNIGFRLPENGDVTLKIYDQSGKILYKTSKQFNKGLNYFIVGNNELNNTGIMYYEINTKAGKQTRKMISMQ